MRAEQRTVNILPICVPRQPAVTDAISCGSRSHHAAFILLASCRGSANAEDRPAGCSNVQRQVPGILSRTRHGSTRQRWLNSGPWTLLHANRDSGRTGEVALDAHVWARRGVEDSRGPDRRSARISVQNSDPRPGPQSRQWGQNAVSTASGRGPRHTRPVERDANCGSAIGQACPEH